MANTYTSLHYHFAFSTKNRYPWISTDLEQRIWEYLGGIARENAPVARFLYPKFGAVTEPLDPTALLAA